MSTDDLPKIKKMTKISPKKSSTASASSSSTSAHKSKSLTDIQKVEANLNQAEKFMKKSVSSLSLGPPITFLLFIKSVFTSEQYIWLFRLN